MALAALMAPIALALTQNPPAAPAGQPAAAQPQRGGNQGRGGIRVMTLTSNAFANGGMIPAKHAQPGRDVSPALSWTGQPDSVASYVLIVHDQSAAMGDGLSDVLHWMVWSIPGSATSLPEGMAQGPQLLSPATLPAPAAGGGGGGQNRPGMRQMSVSGPYYRGPAAPSTGPAHAYVFELYALDVNINVQPVGMSAAETREAVLEAMQGHVRGKGVLVGLYRRSEPPQP
jgi:Raf kinase inhibitor-like YbhB/YbcL family protein